MTPSVDRLAALLEAFDCALLTIVDAEGRPRTRPVLPLKVRFNGHLWFEAGRDGCAEEIGRGADVSVAYAASAAGPCITVYGWAIVLDTTPALPSVWRQPAQKTPSARPRLVCVSARAAEVWDAASTPGRRVFAFSGARPVCHGEPYRHEPAATPRLVAVSGISCAR